MACKFECMKCRHRFERAKPGPTGCPKCGSDYVEWLNAREVLKALGTYWKD
jgi:Zn finger protein HypA/HybF involved in hydrogenase expression